MLCSVRGCRSAALLRCMERPGRYLVRVGWDSIADHLETYPASDQARSVRAMLRPFIEKSELFHYEVAAE